LHRGSIDKYDAGVNHPRADLGPQSNQQDEINQNKVVHLNPAAPFDPFNETPVRGVNFEYGPDFGQATAEEDYQEPRTFRVSLGIRF
jgi:hypothetical protein